MENELVYRLALGMVPHIGDVHARILTKIMGSAEAVFRAHPQHLEKIEGIGKVRASMIRKYRDFDACHAEIRFMEKYGIQPLSHLDDAYPQRLLQCYDAPAMLFYKGNADLNAQRVIAVVGTRNHSAYGRYCCEELIASLAGSGVQVISGLALGIDTIAHRQSLATGMETIGVLAHGLDQLYPSQNRQLSIEMIQRGGLLTDFRSRSNPDKMNFPKRNRIVAGMCDALVVVETGKKGGSMITAALACGYNREVFAYPGRTNDMRSEGCNTLIATQRAGLILNGTQLLMEMNWSAENQAKEKKQGSLFLQLSPEEDILVKLLREKDMVHIDDLRERSSLSTSTVANALLMLEMQGVIESVPGKLYALK